MKACEEWRDVAGYEGLYQVSNLGRVKRLGYSRKEKILKPAKYKDLYFFVILSHNGKRSKNYIHRLVAIAFIPNPENKREVDHIDGNKTNNYVSNLQWCSHRENVNNPNTRHRVGHLGKYGRLHHNSKPVVCIELQCLFGGVREAARETKIRNSTISNAALKRCKTAGGYHWRYATEHEIETAYKLP